jgi:hypothetical protein
MQLVNLTDVSNFAGVLFTTNKAPDLRAHFRAFVIAVANLLSSRQPVDLLYQ